MSQKIKIRLENVEKRYSKEAPPAVESLTLDVYEGEILVLVGPSGCGKSTTLRLINRMIQPTSGSIIIDGEDVTNVNADDLRRRIGYVIQQIGLFPHHTIAENISTVPKLLGWDKQRIAERVDELLATVGLDPEIYRDRYPKELSGGQAQRVGVARALGADPEIMLMDEPFGAIDPITREKLQNEFLRLQADLRKTIVFVTHDIDEAVKMGDRIAILGERSVIAQVDSPDHILAAPANEFVADFLGSGSVIKGLQFDTVESLALLDVPTAKVGDEVTPVAAAMKEAGQEWLLVLDASRRPVSWLSAEALALQPRVTDDGQDVGPTIDKDATLFSALEQLLKSPAGMACVTDGGGKYKGLVDVNHLAASVRLAAEMAEEAAVTARRGASTQPQGEDEASTRS